MRTYITGFPDGTLVRWRSIKWAEYKQLVRDFGEPTGLEGAAAYALCYTAAALCFLDLEQEGVQVEFDELYAGVPYVVGQQILEETGFESTRDKVTKHVGAARDFVANDFYESAKALVCVGFRKDPEEIEDWDIHKLCHYLAMLEKATGQEVQIAGAEEEENQVTPQRYTTGPDGKPIPIITKQDLTKKQRIDVDMDNQGLAKVDSYSGE